MEVTGAWCFRTPFEVAALYLPRAPYKVGAGYRTWGGLSNSMVELGGYDTVVGRTFGDASIVINFSNISKTDLMAASW